MFTAVLAAVLVAAAVSQGMCAEKDMGITREDFVKQLGEAFSRVHCGFSKKAIKEKMQLTKNGAVIVYNSDVMLMMNDAEKSGTMKNAAIVYLTSNAGGINANSIAVFADACIQTMSALDEGLTYSQTKEILNGLGAAGHMLDGIQRSIKLLSYRFMLRMHRNGVVVLAVSHE
jgi:hypothetical protein